MKARAAVRELRKLLKELQEKKYHEPNSDHREYCAGCGRSPHQEPPHEEGCWVPRIAALLERTKTIS